MAKSTDSVSECYLGVSRAKVVFLLTLLALLLTNSLFLEFDDEWDNILGGYRIAHGAALYRDYFSHHFPLPYLISGFVHLFIPNNFILFRLMWAVCLGAVFILTLERFANSRNGLSVVPTLVSLAIIAPSACMHMLIAENIIALCVLISLFYLWERADHRVSSGDLIVLGMLPSVIIMCSIGYVFLACVIGFLAIVIAIRRGGEGALKRISKVGLGALLPIVTILAYLSVNGALSDWYDQSIVFNQKYYFQFTGNTPPDPIGAFLFILENVPRSIAQTFINLLETASWWAWSYAVMLSFIALLCWFKRDKHLAVFGTIAILFFALTRFSPTFSFANSRNAPLYPIGLAAFWTLVSMVPVYNRLRNFTPMLLTFTLSVSILWGFFGRQYVLGEKMISNQDELASFFDSELPLNEQFWIGPLIFRSQYFISKSTPASRYAYFLPWHAASREITRELISDLDRRRPPYIAFDPNFSIWGYSVQTYSKSLMRYINQHYVPVPSHRHINSDLLWQLKKNV